MTTKPIIDAHLDLAWNAIAYDRDQLLSIDQLRAVEAHMTGKGRGRCTTSLPQMRRGGVGICLATVLARARPSNPPADNPTVGPISVRQRGKVILREDLDFDNRTICAAAAQGQLAYYTLLEEQGHMRMIRDAAALDESWSQWQTGASADAPIGFILSMEGTDPMIDPDHAQWWWDHGLRTACLAHYGPSAYAMGTGGDGPLTDMGRELVKQFNRLGMVLDLVHTADTSLAQALELFDGPVFVSHGNCRALVEHDRQISDEQIKWIAQRGGVLGVVLDCWMTRPGWNVRGENVNDVTLDTLANHIDHICQITGSTDHAGIGSDLDGGFGTEQTPNDVDTIADMQKLAPILSARGYSDAEVNAVFHGNWLRFFRQALPAGA